MLSFLAMHIARRDHANTPAAGANREGDMKKPPVVSSAESMKPGFIAAVACVLKKEQGFAKEYLLGFSVPDAMLIDALAAVSGIPFEAFDMCEVDHRVYYQNIRLQRKSRLLLRRVTV